MKTYDAIVSLGGNCAVAHNLEIRGLRSFSLPFDWLLMDDPRPIEYLAEGFRDNFENFCRFENLSEITLKTPHDQPGRLTLKDSYTGWSFIHHFNVSDDFKMEYTRVRKILARRLERLTTMLTQGGTFMFVLAPPFAVDAHALDDLRTVVASRYPRADVSYVIMSFGGASPGRDEANGVTWIDTGRPQNIYDVKKTNWEWAFMDDISVGTVAKGEKHKVHKLRLFKTRKGLWVLRWFLERKELKTTVR